MSKPATKEEGTNELEDNEHRSKRQKILPSSATTEQPAENISFPTEPVCVICNENSSAERELLKSHQCAQCAKDAWSICVYCNEAFLSRICPVCRGPYEPILLYAVPGVPLNKLADASLNDEEKSLLLYKFGIIRHLITKSNVAVWDPVAECMHFSLPREFSDEGDVKKDVSCLTVTIPFEHNRLAADGVFTFNNNIWDEIEQEVESGTSQTGEMMLSKQAVQWLLAFTRAKDHTIYTMMNAKEWENALDPTASPDKIEALKTLKDTLVPNIKVVSTAAQNRK